MHPELELAERRRPARVPDETRAGRDRGGGRYLGVGHAQQDDIRLRNHPAPERALDVDARAAERRSQRAPDASGPDHRHPAAL